MSFYMTPNLRTRSTDFTLVRCIPYIEEDTTILS
jgi:hypothetical protein